MVLPYFLLTAQLALRMSGGFFYQLTSFRGTQGYAHQKASLFAAL